MNKRIKKKINNRFGIKKYRNFNQEIIRRCVKKVVSDYRAEHEDEDLGMVIPLCIISRSGKRILKLTLLTNCYPKKIS